MCIDCKSFYASTEAIKRGEFPTSAKIAVLSREESSGGLILAASPYSKQTYGVKLGTRRFELNDTMNLELVEPHMQDYIKLNYRINTIYRQFTDDAHWFPYSIDESFIDVSASHRLFGDNRAIARQIQQRVFNQTGIITTIGIGPNPLMAKLALDNDAKRQAPWIAEWGYERVPETIWAIPKLTDMWGIGDKIAKRLNAIGIFSVNELAHADIKRLKRQFGVLGEQLYYQAWGIDYSDLSKKYVPRSDNKGYGNSQILMRDYTNPRELETVLAEVADQSLLGYATITSSVNWSVYRLALQIPIKPVKPDSRLKCTWKQPMIPASSLKPSGTSYMLSGMQSSALGWGTVR